MTLLATPALAAPRPRRKPVAARAPAKPFTLPHFRAWASDLILDTGESWHPEPFQDAFAEDLFAGIPECWLIVPEGNGKTTLVAGLALYHAEHRLRAYVAVAASSRDQARVLYQQSEGFVLNSPRLHEFVHSPIQAAKGKRKLDVPRFNPLAGYRRIDHHEGGVIQIYAADDATGDGLIPTFAVLDELHRHRDLRLYRTWAGKLHKRQGQLVTISTAGEPRSEFEEQRERIRKESGTVLRRGSFVRASSKLLVLHEWAVPPKADVEDMAIVKAANPFSGITVKSLADKFASPTMTLEHWRRFTCNMPTRSSNSAIGEAEWDDARAPGVIPAGERILLGLDVAYMWDTTAAVPLWRGPDYRQLGEATILVPPRDGAMLDQRLIKDALRAIHARNPIDLVVMDTSRAEDIAQWLEDPAEGLGVAVLNRGQTNPNAVQDYKRFMEGLQTGKLKHSGDVGLKSHVLNAVARILPLGDARFDRPAETRNTSMQDRRVVDALTAASMVNSYAAERAEELPVPQFFAL